MEDKKINEKESLELITRMIQETQKNTARYSAYPLLVWGYTTVFVTLSVWVLYTFVFPDKDWVMWLWLGIPVIGLPLMYYLTRNEKRIGARNYLDRTVGYVWAVIGSSIATLSLLTLCHLLVVNVLLDISLLISIGSTITGLIVRYRPITVTGILGILLSFGLGTWQVIFSETWSFLWFACIFVVILIIPGHILHAELKKNERA